MNEKFFNYYVEILTSTLHDTLGKNMVFQAESRVDKEEIQTLKSKFEELSNERNNSSQNHEQLQNMVQSLNSRVEELSREKNNIQNILNSKDNESNVFRGQLNDKVNEISSLNNLISNKDQQIEKLSKELEKLRPQNLNKEEPKEVVSKNVKQPKKLLQKEEKKPDIIQHKELNDDF